MPARSGRGSIVGLASLEGGDFCVNIGHEIANAECERGSTFANAECDQKGNLVNIDHKRENMLTNV